MYGSNFTMENAWDIIGMRLPNGKIKVVRNKYGPTGEILESDSAFYGKYRNIITERANKIKA